MVTTEDMDHQVRDINNLLMVAQEDLLLWALNQDTWDGSMVNMVVVARLLHILGVDTLPHLHREACIRKGVDHRWHPIVLVLAMERGMREVHQRRCRLQVVVVENQRRDKLRKLQTVQGVLLMDRYLLVATSKGGGDILVNKQVSGDLSISGEPDHRQCIVVGLRCINHRMAAAQECTVAALILQHGVESVIQEDLQKWWETILEDQWEEAFAKQLTVPKWICTLVDAVPVTITMTMKVRWRGEIVPKTRDEGATSVEG
jgi:hypothetical protein